MDQLISIVTLTYKKFDKLYKAIDSILMQDYPNIEYIISDDGSLDFPEDDIRAYVSANRKDNLSDFRIIMHKSNIGTVKNLNDAYREARGEIIIPVSEDDSFTEKNIVSRIAKEYRKRNCDTLVIGRSLFNEQGEFVRNIPSKREAAKLNALKDNKAQYQAYITGRFYEAYSGCALSVKKGFIESRGYFDEKYVLLEDAPFFAQYLWDNYLECDFDIIGIQYNEGGVSTGGKHPLLLKDDEVFRKTDRIAHLDELTFFQKEIVWHGITRANDKSTKGRIIAALKHPIGFIGIKIYRFSLSLLRD